MQPCHSARAGVAKVRCRSPVGHHPACTKEGRGYRCIGSKIPHLIGARGDPLAPGNAIAWRGANASQADGKARRLQPFRFIGIGCRRLTKGVYWGAKGVQPLALCGQWSKTLTSSAEPGGAGGEKRVGRRRTAPLPALGGLPHSRHRGRNQRRSFWLRPASTQPKAAGQPDAVRHAPAHRRVQSDHPTGGHCRHLEAKQQAQVRGLVMRATERYPVAPPRSGIGEARYLRPGAHPSARVADWRPARGKQRSAQALCACQ